MTKKANDHPLGECQHLNETDPDLCNPLDDDATCLTDEDCQSKLGQPSRCCYVGCSLHCVTNNSLVHVCKAVIFSYVIKCIKTIPFSANILSLY